MYMAWYVGTNIGFKKASTPSVSMVTLLSLHVTYFEEANSQLNNLLYYKQGVVLGVVTLIMCV